MTDRDALNTDEARRLLTGLRELLPLAEAVDAQRGHTVDQEILQAPVENPARLDNSHGTDIAQTLETLVLRLQQETQGA